MQVTGNFSDFYNTTMLANLRAIVDRGYKRRTPQFQKLFHVMSSTRSLEQFSQVSGVGRFQYINEGGKIQYDQPVQGFNSSFTHARWGLAVPTSVDVIEDDKWRLITTMHTDLGISGRETRELQAAALLNNAFTANGPDGVPLCSASHPLYKAGGVQSNLMAAADLGVVSLQLALTAFETQRRPSGELIHVTAAKLVHAPANRFNAYRLTKSAMDPESANNSVNPLKGAEDGMPTPFTYHYLTAPNAWFLMAMPEETGLVWFDRKKPYTKSWTDDETEVGVIGMRYKKSQGITNYIGVLGNPGS